MMKKKKESGKSLEQIKNHLDQLQTDLKIANQMNDAAKIKELSKYIANHKAILKRLEG
jgi:conjugal transfer/entry exclusion protein